MLTINDNNRKWWTLIAMSGALALVFIDQTALAVALPAIQRDLNLSNGLLQWVINAYLLALSALILLGGKLGDSLGHKPAFLFGVITFISASILCALAQSGPWLIGARFIQGLGGAFMMPSTNALVVNAFPDKERGKAVGIYVGLAAVFLALGPLMGGALTEWFGWRAVFWINFPVALVSIFLTASVVPRWQANEKLTVDYLGVFLSILFISAFVLAFMEGPHFGWASPTILSLFGLGLCSLLGFLFWEKRAHQPLVNLSLFNNPVFSIVVGVMVIIQAVGIVFVFWAIFVQNVLNYSPLMAGLLLSPAMVPIIFMAPIGGHLRDKYGPALPMFWGCTLVILSLIWLGIFCHLHRYIALFPGLLTYGIGLPLMLSGSMTTALNTVSTQQRGIASAILNCARQFGNSIGLAIFASFLGSLNTWHLSRFLRHASPEIARIPESHIDGLLVKAPVALKLISHLPASSVALLETAARKAYTQAFSLTMYFAASFGIVCLLLIVKFSIRNK